MFGITVFEVICFYLFATGVKEIDINYGCGLNVIFFLSDISALSFLHCVVQ